MPWINGRTSAQAASWGSNHVRRTITLRDGAPEDKPLVAAAFERLSEDSRYRRFFATKNELSRADLAYLVDVDHKDHEAIIAIDPSSGEMLGVARYSTRHPARRRVRLFGVHTAERGRLRNRLRARRSSAERCEWWTRGWLVRRGRFNTPL